MYSKVAQPPFGLEINTEENVMGNVNMIIEDIDKAKIDKIFS